MKRLLAFCRAMVICLLLLAGSISYRSAYAQNNTCIPSFNSALQEVIFPCVIIDSYCYPLVIGIQNNLIFLESVMDAFPVPEELQDASAYCPSYDATNNILHIPLLNVGGRQYAIDLQAVFADDLVSFVISAVEPVVCPQVIVYARPSSDDCWSVFPTPCDVPAGWEISFVTPPAGEMCDE